MRDAYIVTSIRTPGCRRGKGAFKDTRPEDLLSFILSAAVDKTDNLEKKDVEDLMIGCSFPEAEQGLNIGRIASQMAGFPVETTGATVNRFCSSGLEAIALASLRVMAGWSDVVIGGGLESMTYVPMGGNLPRPHPEFTRKGAQVYTSMGITAENVANRYNVTREAQDEFALQSHMKAAEAKNKGLFQRTGAHTGSPLCDPARRHLSTAKRFCRILMTVFGKIPRLRVWPICVRFLRPTAA